MKIAFFPEAAYGPALNSVGIAQACQGMGFECVFLTAPDMAGVYADYGFEEHLVSMSAPMSAEDSAAYWQNFIDGHIPNFNKSPYEQIDTYVKDCWDAIVETAIWAQKSLPDVLDAVKPDLICVDNVILFPAIKQFGKPWVRIISCSENEIPDPDIPPHLSGCGENDKACFEAYENRFQEVVKDIHDRFNEFLAKNGEAPYLPGEFFEASPFLTILLYPEPVKFQRRHPLEGDRYLYLEGCVRQDVDYVVPQFPVNQDKPLLYVSFGSLGCGDTETLQKLITALGKQPVRVLMNVGSGLGSYTEVPPNVILDKWFPQPSVIPQVDAVIHHGGNNTFTECLLFGKPALIMPYVWDGHDNATRVQETGHGLKMHRADWTDAELAAAVQTLLTDKAIAERLAATSASMKESPGPEKAALRLASLLGGPLLRVKSSAPHARNASTLDVGMVDWGLQPDAIAGQSKSRGRLLHKGPDGKPEVALWRCTPGHWPLALDADELCYFTGGRATYTSKTNEVIEVEPGTVIHFKTGWSGHCVVHETIFVTYMLCEGGPAETTPVLRDVKNIPAQKEWGAIPTMIEGVSETSGILLSRESDGRCETGIWICTPGTWNCHVTSDEYCHFLSGRCTYTHESGEVIEIAPDTLAFFPLDWKGVCKVHETVRKVYVIR